MPTLNWIGKDAVVNHHHDVPFRVLEKKYTFGENGTNDDCRDVACNVSTDQPSDNKIIHGDNLEALKALLPEYEGRIKCIYIDPPYNTGNENWVYNDNVNSPKIRKWLGQVVGKEAEDLTRHDKWLCMMYPRLVLLQKLLSDDGAIFISIDDNEQANLKLICDEIFGAGNFVNSFVWKRNSSGKNEVEKFTVNTEYILLYKKSNKCILKSIYKPLAETSIKLYNKDDNDGRGRYQTVSLQKPASPGPETTYDYIDNSGKVWKCPPKGWRMVYSKIKALECDNRLVLTGNTLRVKDYWNERNNEGKRVDTLWNDLPENTEATKMISKIFDGVVVFNNPKPIELIQRCIQVSDSDSIILDSFAGSGTTAHAVLNLNKTDGGNRKFILVEMEDYAETITAERVRRVIDGYGDTEGTGGSFDFYELGEPVFNEDGYLNENIGTEKLREYIWYTETRTPLPHATVETGHTPSLRSYNDNRKNETENGCHGVTALQYLLGNHNGTAYYFYYEKDQITTLDKAFLNSITRKAEQYVIYADNCLLSDDFMRVNNIIFKKIPRDVRKF